MDQQAVPLAEELDLSLRKTAEPPGVKVYTHVNYRFAPFASQYIPVTVSEAPYLLDGLTI